MQRVTVKGRLLSFRIRCPASYMLKVRQVPTLKPALASRQSFEANVSGAELDYLTQGLQSAPCLHTNALDAKNGII